VELTVLAAALRGEVAEHVPQLLGVRPRRDRALLCPPHARRCHKLQRVRDLRHILHGPDALSKFPNLSHGSPLRGEAVGSRR
jgi:hypothetical protein